VWFWGTPVCVCVLFFSTYFFFLEVDGQWEPISNPSPIQSVDVFESEDGRRLVLNCETTTIMLETSFATREINIKE
jgi:hypothetical protein